MVRRMLLGKYLTIGLCLCLHGASAAYDNIALDKPSYINGAYFNDGTADASEVNDGNRDNNPHYPGNSCTHTAGGQQQAWWNVDLQFIARIHEVNLTSRQSTANRFAGFALYVSNTSDVLSGTKCYQQTGPLPNLNTTTYQCSAVGQFLTVFYARFQNTTYPSDYSEYAICELCEVEVPGCAYQRFGENCNKQCHCKERTCDYTTGKCNSICEAGYKGEACNQTCDPGSFGESCQLECPNCGGSEACNQSGICLNGCKAGVYPGSSPGCQNTCGKCVGTSCLANGNCPSECTDGYYLMTCTASCVDKCIRCEQQTGTCTLCDDGFYGRNCTNVCPTHCSGNRCDIKSGDCLVCDAGYYGAKCEFECPHCGGDQSCNRSSGVCSNGCDAGYYPNQHPGCNATCGNCAGIACNVNGDCPNGCSDGYFSMKCTAECPTNCKDKKCGQITGECDACIEGYYGSNCSLDCPTHCLNKICGIQSGICAACDAGYYGDKCEFECPNCGVDNSCSQSSGVCSSGCQAGYYPNQHPGCNATCGNCQDVTCEMDGNCPIGCLNGYFLPNCTAECASNCYNGTCEGQSGNCLSCVDGYYGEICSIPCPTQCKDKKCDIETGNCLACENGYFGNKCESLCLNCGGNNACNETGLCTNGCDAGYFSGGQPGCPETCGNCRDGSACDIDGNCTQGCSDGYNLWTCKGICPTNCLNNKCDRTSGNCSSCVTGYYGIKCDEVCSEHCSQSSCEIETGRCVACSADRVGEYCQSVKSSPTNVSAVVGPIIAVIVLVIIIAVIIVIYRRRRGNTKKPDLNTMPTENRHNENLYQNRSIIREDSKYRKMEQIGLTENQNKTVDEGDVYINISETTVKASDSGIPVQSFRAYVKSKKTEELEKEYKSIPSGDQHPHVAAETSENNRKNRFKTTFPYDHSRVILDSQQDRKGDYINANYIDSTDDSRKYIATQGPLKNTIGDFWRMVWEQNVGKIIMLTNLKEFEKVKCEKYWPDPNKPMRYDTLEIRCLDQRELASYVIRTFRLENKKTREERNIMHFHFTTWPDHGVPNDLQLVAFHRRIINAKTQLSGPVVVHCSAGIGRTGTYIGLDAVQKQGLKTGRVDVNGYVHTMRKDRPNMIQTAKQYIALHTSLVEALETKETMIPKTEFPAEWIKMKSDSNATNERRLRKEYENLIMLKSHNGEITFRSASLEENISKNRNQSIKAADKYRPFLAAEGGGRTDYINAVILPTNLKSAGYIATQRPMKSTILDFWQMVEEQDITSIILFEDTASEKIGFFPTSAAADIGVDNGAITFKTETGYSDDVSVIELEKTYNDKEENTIIRIHKVNMKRRRLPTAKQMLKVNDLACPWEIPGTPVVISLEGTSPCDVYCTVTNIQGSLKIDDEVDIFQTARQLLHRRPEFFRNYETYELCFETLNEHLNADSIYCNA